MVIKNNVFVIIVCINFFLVFASGFLVAGLYHDVNTLRRYNDTLRQSIAEVRQDQKAIEKDIRQVKTDSDLMLRIVVSGQYAKEDE